MVFEVVNSGDYVEHSLLGSYSYVTQYGKNFPKCRTSEKVDVVYSSTLNLEAVRSSEIYVISSKLHGVTSRKIVLFIGTSIK